MAWQNKPDWDFTPLDALTFRLEDLPRHLRRIIDDALQDHGLSRTQWRLLAYVMRQPLNIYALVGCRTPDEFAANLAAMVLALTPAELAWLDLKA